MKLYNLTNSVLCFAVGHLRVQVEPNSVSNTINMTPESIKGAILPLINMYGNKILLVLNSVELTLIGKTGYHLPADNVVDHEYAQRQIDFNLNRLNNNKPKETKPTTPRDDLSAGVPANKLDIPKSPEVPEVKVIPGNHK